MEIIEHGKTYKILTCTYCGCVFATCEKDVYWDESLDFACVECPECEEKISANKQVQ